MGYCIIGYLCKYDSINLSIDKIPMTYDDLLKWRIISIIACIFLCVSVIFEMVQRNNTPKFIPIEDIEVPHIPSPKTPKTHLTAVAAAEINEFKTHNPYAKEVYVSYADFITNTISDVFVLSDYDVGYDRYSPKPLFTANTTQNNMYYNVLGGKIECNGEGDLTACTISIPPNNSTQQSFGGFLTIMYDDVTKSKTVKEVLYSLSILIDRGNNYEN